MVKHPIAFTHDDYQECAQVIVDQLESRDNDPILILIGECLSNSPTLFHRKKEFFPDGQWSWKAVDDRGREVLSGVLHQTMEPPPLEMDEAEEMALSGHE